MDIPDVEHPIGSSIMDNVGINFIILVRLLLLTIENSKPTCVASAPISSDMLMA